MKLRSFILLFIVTALMNCSCSSSNEITPDESKPHKDSTNILLMVKHLRPLRLGEDYTLWLSYLGDPIWHKVGGCFHNANYYLRADDSTSIFFPLVKIPDFDSITAALVSLENDSLIEAPTLRLWESALFGDSTRLTGKLDGSLMESVRSLIGSILFTTQSADTTAYIYEPYLAAFDGSKFSSSLLALPTLGAGWKYGMWSVDSNNFPPQYIYYGQFTDPMGHDSDSAHDNLSFPGGFTKAPMNQPSGAIIVTLEPDWYGNAVKVKGPSPLTLLRFNRQRFLVSDHNYPMSNVVTPGALSGTITITSK